ncbi:MAG TPA: acyl carrier protein [Pseudonocardiaceae bacterium]
MEHTAILDTPDIRPDGSMTAAVAALVAHLVSVKPSLDRHDIHPDASLTVDLGFDSLDLVALATEIRDSYPAFDLRSWLAGACQFGDDNIHALAVRFAELAVTGRA